VVGRFGGLDVLVNSAGVAPGGNIEELTDDDWERGIQLKLLGLIRCTRAAIPVMRRQGGGRIVNVVGNDGVKCAYWEIVPAICCAAELIFTATLAEEYGPEGIYVNAVNPGPVETGLMRGLFEQVARRRGLSVEEVVDAHVESIPLKLGRIAEPREVTDVVLFLASDRATFVNGVSVNVDGGQMKAGPPGLRPAPSSRGIIRHAVMPNYGKDVGTSGRSRSPWSSIPRRASSRAPEPRAGISDETAARYTRDAGAARRGARYPAPRDTARRKLRTPAPSTGPSSPAGSNAG
jgi:enoyl-[acyl-carrier-protein] reductase (NADH)